MNSRMNEQTDRILVEWVRDLRCDLDELKRGNQTVGPDSMIMRRIATGNTWDINNAVLPDYTEKSWKVTYVPTTLKNAYADLSYRYVVNSGDVDGVLITGWPDTSNTNPNQRSWIVNGYYNPISTSNATVSVVFAVRAGDTGTLSVVAV